MLMIIPTKDAYMAFAFAILLVLPGASNAEDWPQWQGPDRNGLTSETGLLKSWPTDGPNRLWLFRDCGKGYAGPAIVDGKLYILASRRNTTSLLCLSATSGEEIWDATIGEDFDNHWGDGPRATPTVDGDFAYAMSGPGLLACIRLDDGHVVWKKSMIELGGSVPSWGYCESVLIDGDKLLCTPGGDQGAVAALDKRTGDLLLRSTEVQDGAQYSSIIKVAPHGVEQYVQLLEKRLIGLSMDGRLLWEGSWPGATATIPTPLYYDGFVYATSGYGAGCALFELTPDGSAVEVYRNKQMKNQHGGAVRVGEFVYGYSDGPGWMCHDFRTGEREWRERGALGKGAVGYADGMLYCVAEKTGEVVLIEATPAGWSEQGRFTLEPQTEIRKPDGRIWVHPVIANGKLYLRDQDLLYCYDVSAE